MDSSLDIQSIQMEAAWLISAKLKASIRRITDKESRKAIVIYSAVLLGLIWLYIYFNPSKTGNDIWNFIKTDGLKLLISTLGVIFGLYILSELTGRKFQK